MVEGSRQAGASEITEQMIDEGTRVYCEFCPDTGAGDGMDREMVRCIFRAMERARSADKAVLPVRALRNCGS